jgi:hypothetical protein
VRSRLVTTSGVVDVPEAATADAVRTEDGLVWVDLDHTDEPGMAPLPQLFDVRPTDLEDCYTRTPVPKPHLHPDHHYTAIDGLSRARNPAEVRSRAVRAHQLSPVSGRRPATDGLTGLRTLCDVSVCEADVEQDDHPLVHAIATFAVLHR